MLRIVFMGTAAFAVPCLEALVGAGHTVLAVATQPDRPRGRGMKLQPGPVKSTAEALGLPVLQPEKASLPEFAAALRELAPELIVVVAYGQILRAAVLEIPPRGCINVHGSLLPELRGAAPIQWAVIRGAAESGVTTMYMDPGMDTGDMILAERLTITPEDTADTLAARLAPVGAALLARTLTLVERGEAPRVPQDSSRATYAPMLKREDGALAWAEPAAALRNRVHGCNPAPGAYFGRLDETVKVWRAEVTDADPAAAPGTVLGVGPLVVAAGRGGLRLLEVQPRDRSRMDGEAFCRGYRVAPGEVWGNGTA